MRRSVQYKYITEFLYTGLEFRSKKHFYGRVAPVRILALHMQIDLFTAAERPERILVSKCTFTGRLRAFCRINLVLYFYDGGEKR